MYIYIYKNKNCRDTFNIYTALLCCQMCTFAVPSGRRGRLFFLREQMYTSGSTFKKIKSFACHYISMHW